MADFRDKLVEAIDADESNEGRAGYYQRWVRALEQLALDRGLVTSVELDARTETYALDRERRTLIRTYGAKSTLGTEYVR